MNGIAEKITGLIFTKAHYLLLDSNLDRSFWLNALHTIRYLLNQTLSSILDYDIPLEACFQAYQLHDHNYNQDLNHFIPELMQISFKKNVSKVKRT